MGKKVLPRDRRARIEGDWGGKWGAHLSRDLSAKRPSWKGKGRKKGKNIQAPKPSILDPRGGLDIESGKRGAHEGWGLPS